ncbi:MAG: SGNH/GDSL hydrolase family protein [Candidatus Cyclonatronum sp.]|uniref:SGNH/GDSL hydrolase family protein n=1 Tax=Cyclonatronum sp. TaxID=3024185 RepID=UPI0025BB7F7A|nr:SGNH/GDSL hydrolase family protein [Cyclonatronum sp.]MCH8485219.1 SGNH/GDSL hydrolase family protein [Cyclonatronum sp.]
MIKNLAAFFTGLLAALIIAEVLLRLWSPIEIRVRGNRIMLPYERIYEFQQVDIPRLDEQIRHTKNSLGFRGPEPDGKPHDVARIIAVGGSTTEGFYLSDGKDWPAVMASALNAAGHEVWVNNAAMDGHSTIGHLILLEDHLLPLQPDFIILKAGLNDIGRSDSYERRVRSGLRFSSAAEFVRSASYYSEVVATGLHLYRIYLAGDAGVRHQFLDLKQQPVFEEIDREEAERALAWHAYYFTEPYRNRLSRFVEMSLESGIMPVLVTQAILAGEGTDPLTGVDLAKIEYRGGSGYQLWRVLQLYNETTREVARAYGIPLIDLAAKMGKSSEYFYDMFHFSNAGAAVAGTIIASGMTDILVHGKAE